MPSVNGRKLLRNSKNLYKAETVQKCSIDKIGLIKYNRVRSRIKVHKLMNNKREIDV